jgi:hypothetical protein
MSRSDDLSVFVERPTDIKRLIDFIIATSPATKASARSCIVGMVKSG